MFGEIGKAAGIVAGVLNSFAIIPYVRAILRGETKPHRASWIVWMVAGVIAAASYYSSGARQTMWTAVSYALNPLIVLGLSLRYGVGGWSRLDRLCLAGAACSLILWWMSGSALATLVWILTLDFMGAVPTIRKVWTEPSTEDRSAWTMNFVANSINFLALEGWTFALVVQPLYVFLSGVVITLPLYLLRRTR